MNINITDMNGRIVYQGFIKDKKGYIQLPNLPDGIYIANFYNTEKNIRTSKKIKYSRE